MWSPVYNTERDAQRLNPHWHFVTNFFSSSTLFIFSSGDTAGAALHICHGVKSSFDHHHRVIVWRMARGMLFVYMHLMFIDYYYCVVCVVRYVKGVRSAHLFTQNIWINESTGEQQKKSTSESLNEWYFCCVYRTLLSAIMEIPNFRCFWIEKKMHDEGFGWQILMVPCDGDCFDMWSCCRCRQLFSRSGLCSMAIQQRQCDEIEIQCSIRPSIACHDNFVKIQTATHLSEHRWPPFDGMWLLNSNK